MNTITIFCVALTIAIATACEAYKRLASPAYQAAHPFRTHAFAAIRALVPNPLGLGLQIAAALSGKASLATILIAQAQLFADAYGTTPEVGAEKIASVVAKSIAPPRGPDGLPLPRMSAPSLPTIDTSDLTTPVSVPSSEPSSHLAQKASQ